MKRYISKIKQLKLVWKPGYAKEVDGRVVSIPGNKVEFDEGYFETDDEDTQAFLEGHQNFGTIFIEVPNVAEAVKKREEWQKSLEQREKEIAEREAEIKKKELEVKPHEEGKVEDELNEKTVLELRKVAKEKGVSQVGTKEELIKRIREVKEEQPAYE